MVMSQFPLQDYDIRFVVMEVTRGPGWLEMDTRFFLNGFAKIAVLGRDLVYAKLSTREMFHAKFRWARWLGSVALSSRSVGRRSTLRSWTRNSLHGERKNCAKKPIDGGFLKS
eukprot:GEMP01058614.1.p1 GENE.GEMP01058614.1~~GEMP01058614.1.p1  ORF type:complete len:113 (+),score=9.98 GEMP01058614.1:488-826(+)